MRLLVHRRRCQRHSRYRRHAAPLVGLLASLLLLACGPRGGAADPAAPAAPAAPPAAGRPIVNGPATPPVRLRIAYSEVYPGATIPWTTYEAGLFRKHGLDAELTYIASSQTVPAVLANEVDIALGAGFAVISSRLAGSDLKLFLGVVNWFQYELMVAPEIQTAADLKGQRLGVSRFGSASDVATRVALQQLGLVPDEDVTILQTGSLQERIAAMQAGAVQGGVAAPPEPLRFRRLGFRSLYDMASSGLQDMPSIAFARAEWLNANQGLAQAFTDAIVDGIHFAKTNPDFTKQVLTQYLKLDDPELLDVSYNYFTGANLNRVPDPGREGARRYLTEGPGASDPRAAGVPLDEYFDMRFVERVQASGFVRQLYGAER